jgi:hypothetical protein
MKMQKINTILCIVLGIACIALAIGLANMDTVPPTRTEFAEMISQTNTTAVFVTEDGHLFAAEVGELLELYTDYIIVFDTNRTADRTDDEILSVSKLIK